MKKIFSFFRSMRFGILLLVLIAILSVVGTAIPQGREIAWYARTYGSSHGVILMLKLNDVFHSWYFQLLLILLGLNLTLCSLVRVRSVKKAKAAETEMILKMTVSFPLNDREAETVRAGLRAMRCREETAGDAVIFRKNGFGRYGSFITHLSILLTIIFGAVALYLPKTVDRSCLPGESLVMEDGTDFRRELSD